MLTNLMWMFLLPSIITSMEKLYILKIHKDANLKTYLIETNSDTSNSFNGAPLCMEDNIVYNGQDITDTGKRVSNEQECHKYCEEVSECEVWVYYKERKTCQLKIFHDDLQKENNNEYTSGQKVCSKGSPLCMEDNIVYNGQDITDTGKRVSNEQECHKYCEEVSKCEVWVYYKERKTCQLKILHDDLQKENNNEYTSGQKVCSKGINNLSRNETETQNDDFFLSQRLPALPGILPPSSPKPTKTIGLPATIPSICSNSEFYPHPTDCHKFYHCSTGHVPIPQSCPNGTRWSIQLSICDHSYKVVCPNKGQPKLGGRQPYISPGKLDGRQPHLPPGKSKPPPGQSKLPPGQLHPLSDKKGSRYSAPANACLKGFSILKRIADTLEECKEICSTFSACRSLNYKESKKKCILSNETKQTKPVAYKDPCRRVTHLERRGSTYSASINACLNTLYVFNERMDTLDKCKLKCNLHSQCRSLDYNERTKKCFIYKETKKTKPAAYKEPCYNDTYLENIGDTSQAIYLENAWRDDRRCGMKYPASNGKTGQCDPTANGPCCSYYGWCGNSANHCNCSGCVNYAAPTTVSATTTVSETTTVSAHITVSASTTVSATTAEVCEDFGTPPDGGCKCLSTFNELCFSPKICISGGCRSEIL